MTRLTRIAAILVMAALSLVFIEAAWAQQAGVTTTNWKELIATLINTAGVMLVVQAVKQWMPYFADKYGFLMPVLAMVAGPLVATLQAFVGAKLGYQVDFSLIVAALTGGAAVAAHQIYAQHKQGPTGIAMKRP